MSGKIDVDELRVGMFIHLDLSWMQHPFPVGSFRISHAQQIDKIRSLGLKQLRWSPEKSELVPPPPAEHGIAAGAAARRAGRRRGIAGAGGRTRAARAAVGAARLGGAVPEAVRRSRPWPGARRRTASSPGPSRRGSDTEGLTRALLDKMLVDGDMCIRLLTCNAGDNASAHAMNVAVISLLMGRVFGLGDDEMLDLGIGALMHDVGKIDLPERLRHLPTSASARTTWPPTATMWRTAWCTASAWACGPARCWCWRSTTSTPTASGFPLRLKLERMSVAARIVALVNRYDNLCNPPVLAHGAHAARGAVAAVRAGASRSSTRACSIPSSA